jgi:peptidoglycan hydrolase-like protein with peptidoglycan-binding domain
MARAARAAAGADTGAAQRQHALQNRLQTWSASPSGGAVEDGRAVLGRGQKDGAAGGSVELAQRALNILNDGSKRDLAVDGKFGPKTESMVKRFQSANGLPATGKLDANTWNLLHDTANKKGIAGEKGFVAEPDAGPSPADSEGAQGPTFLV